MRLGLFCLSVVLLLAVVSPAAAVPRRVPEGFFGVNGQPVFIADYTDQELASAADAMGDLGIERLRRDIEWNVVQPTGPTDAEWASIDRFVLALASEGVAVEPIVGFTPAWARVQPCMGVTPPSRCRPASASVFATFAAKVAERYGQGGNLWEENPEVTARPIETIEIWNEPNSNFYGPHPQDVGFYGQMYRAARTAISAVDPTIVTVVGGLVPGPVGTFVKTEMLSFLNGMGSPDQISGIALHSYGKTGPTIFGPLVALRGWMDAAHLSLQARKIYLNEWGWLTNEFPESPGYTGDALTESQRAALFTDVATTLARSDCGIARVIPHTWETRYEDHGNAEHWFGIALVDELSPTAEAFGDTIRQLRGDTGLGSAPRETVHLCVRPPPDLDGDGVEDQHDYAPTDPNVQVDPTTGGPASYEPPRLLGTVKVGATVTATPGTWNGSPIPSFSVERWEHCDAALQGCQTIPGATGWQVIPSTNLLGRRLRVVVSATNGLGSAVATSDGHTVESAPMPVAAPTISGQARVGQTLFASTGQWSALPTPTYAFQWYLCNSSNNCWEVSGATGGSWTVTVLALGQWVKVRVTASNAHGSATQESAKKGPVTF